MRKESEGGIMEHPEQAPKMNTTRPLYLRLDSEDGPQSPEDGRRGTGLMERPGLPGVCIFEGYSGHGVLLFEFRASAGKVNEALIDGLETLLGQMCPQTKLGAKPASS